MCIGLITTLKGTFQNVYFIFVIFRTIFCPFRIEKRKRHLTSDSDLTKDYPKENDSSRYDEGILLLYQAKFWVDFTSLPVNLGIDMLSYENVMFVVH